MNVGVVGNPSYRDLRSILAHLATVAPRLGVTLFTEASLEPHWPDPHPAWSSCAPGRNSRRIVRVKFERMKMFR